MSNLAVTNQTTNQGNSLDNHEQIISMFAKNCEYKERHLQLHILEAYPTTLHHKAQSNVSSPSSNSASTHTNTVQTRPEVRFFFGRDSPTVGQGLLLHEVSWSHTTTHHSRYDSSGRMISPSQRPLPDNTQHSQQTSMPPLGFETTISADEPP